MLIFKKRVMPLFNSLLCCSVSFLFVYSQVVKDSEFPHQKIFTSNPNAPADELKMRSTQKSFDNMVNDAPISVEDLTVRASSKIDMIVRHTVARYLDMIQTRPDWLRCLLQLVREERDIRSKYHCSTDACIYKIQLFVIPFRESRLTKKRNAFKKSLKRSGRSADSTEVAVNHGDTFTEQLEPLKEKSYLKSRGSDLEKVVGNEGADALLLPEPLTPTIESERESVALSPDLVEFQEMKGGVIGQNNHAQRDISITQAFYKQPKRPIEKELGDRIFPADYQGISYLDQTEHREESKKSHSDIEVTVPTLRNDDKTEIKHTTPTKFKADSQKEETVDKSETSNLGIEFDASLDAIQSETKTYSRGPYEECTGRYKDYCFNAHECQYISGLETALCFCEMGYTGVRCDMFDLPGTLKMLKPFKDNVVNFKKLDVKRKILLYDAVEAIARYTVNAALQDDHLATWSEDIY